MKLATAIAAVAVLVLIAPASSLAANGTYTQMLCFNPDTGQGVGAPTEVRRLGGPPFPHLDIDCAGTATAASGLTLRSGLPAATSHGMAGELEYRAPADVELTGGQIYRIFRVSGGGQRVSLAQHAGASLNYFALPRSELIQWWPNGLHNLGSSTALWDTGNRLQLAVSDGVWRYTGGCDSSDGCTVAPDSVWVRIFGGKLILRDAANPQLVGEISGALVESGVMSGLVDATFSASDAGAGLYRTHVLVDDASVSTGIVDGNSGRCADVNTQNSDAHEFGSAIPCKNNAAVTASLDTRSVADGVHRVKVVIEDAAGNTTTVFNKSVIVANKPVSSAFPTVTGVITRVPTLAFFVSRKRLRNGQAARYFGSLSGPGHARRFVDVQVRKSKNRWQVVCSVQTDEHGRYACRHRFNRTFRKTRYVFRARVRAQVGFSSQTLVTGRRAIVVRP